VSVFASDRERRLWIWTGVVAAALFSTVVLTGTLSGLVPQHALLAVAFMLGMVLVGATILTLGLRSRPRGLEIAAALGVAAAYLMLLVRVSIPERTHLIEYGVLAAFLHEALAERASHGRRVPVPALLAAGVTALVGVLDECLQALLPHRVFDPRDILFNVLAATMAVFAKVALGWARWQTARLRGKAAARSD
jgi:peptidoglycan/LPS O-acetylase OafA/YrhL